MYVSSELWLSKGARVGLWGRMGGHGMDFKILFIFREGEKERERNIDV